MYQQSTETISDESGESDSEVEDADAPLLTRTETKHADKYLSDDKPSHSQPDDSEEHKGNRAWKLRAAASYYFSFIGLGMVMSALGPTLPGLAQLFGAGEATNLAPLLTARGVGYTAGTLGMGYLVSKYPSQRHRLLVLSSSLMGLLAIMMPRCSGGSGGIGGLYVVMGLMSLFGGALDLGGNVCLVVVWRRDPWSAAMMNLLHFFWGVGSLCAPLVAEGVGLQASQQNATWLCVGLVGMVVGLGPLVVDPPQDSTDENADTGPSASEEPSQGKIAIDGDDALLIEEDPAANADTNDVIPTSSPAATLSFKVAIAMLFFYYFAYAGAEHTPGDWLATYALVKLNASEDDGANLTAMYWGLLTFGRLVGAVLTVKLSAVQMMGLDMAFCVLGCLLLLTWGSATVSGAYVAVALLGMGLSTLYPMGIMLAEEKLSVSGSWISVFISGGTIGSVVLPLLVGLLLAKAPLALAWAETGFILSQLLCWLVVKSMPAKAARNAPTLSAEDTGANPAIDSTDA
eukprot:m.727961 g.727961  ORF g.727961 m.727961 type:complete len:516 (-) comp23041_c0_seq2:1959-3506(-)